MSSIFICHSSTDKPFVRTLKSRLSSYDVAVWVDEDEIRGGDSLIGTISDAIEKMEYLGIVLSPNAVRSKWVKEELELALTNQISDRHIRVVPPLLRQCELPSFLKGKMYIDFSEWSRHRKNKADALHEPIQALVRAIGVDPRNSERYSGRRMITRGMLQRVIEDHLWFIRLEWAFIRRVDIGFCVRRRF